MDVHFLVLVASACCTYRWSLELVGIGRCVARLTGVLRRVGRQLASLVGIKEGGLLGGVVLFILTTWR